MIIDHTTFKAVGAEHNGVTDGVVTVTLRGVTKEVTAWRISNGRITAQGFIGRYRTSTKNWNATITQLVEKDGKRWEMANFGRDERAGRCNKMDNIWFKD